MKNKKPIILQTALAIAMGLAFAGAASATDAKDRASRSLIPKEVTDIFKRDKPTTPTPTTPVNMTNETQTTALPADAGCPKMKKTSKIPNPLELSGRKILKDVMNNATESLKLGSDVELPAEIENHCQATKRLSYVEQQTGRWSTRVIDSIQQAKTALSLSGEAASYAAFRNNPDFTAADGAQISQLQKDMRSDLSAIETAIAEKRAANKELLAEAGTNMRSALAQGTLIGAWDKRLIEFMGENATWAVREHLADARIFGSHVELLGDTLTSMSSVLKAHDAVAGEPSPAALKKAEAQRKQREKENAEYEQQLLAQLQL